MTILILSRKAGLYSTRRLSRAGKKKGHRVVVVDPIQCSLALDGQEHMLLYQGKRLKGFDVVIPRIGAAIADYGISLVSHLESMGIPTLNTSVSIARAKDKAILQTHGLKKDA
jgi:ribosomal protein S6--L-glutamate ligase